MKRVTLFIALFSFAMIAPGQINLENTYNFSGTYTKLANSGYKFYIMDVGTSQCRIYNTNHTLWKTINLSVPAGNYLYDIKFVSENLFTTDNSLALAYIYYNYNAAGQYYTYNARIVKENGTELLSIPGCQYLYIHNLNELGTKLVAYCYDYSQSPYIIQTKVYNLPGQLVSAPADKYFFEPVPEAAFPNPANEFTTIPYTLPSDIVTANLVLKDSQGRIVKNWPLERNSNQKTINTSQFPHGVYFYSIYSGNYHSEDLKLIIQ